LRRWIQVKEGVIGFPQGIAQTFRGAMAGGLRPVFEARVALAHGHDSYWFAAPFFVECCENREAVSISSLVWLVIFNLFVVVSFALTL
jgi:hypothetical protein